MIKITDLSGLTYTKELLYQYEFYKDNIILGTFGISIAKNRYISFILLSYFNLKKIYRGFGISKFLAMAVNLRLKRIMKKFAITDLLIETIPYEGKNLSKNKLQSLYVRYFKVEHIFGDVMIYSENVNNHLFYKILSIDEKIDTFTRRELEIQFSKEELNLYDFLWGFLLVAEVQKASFFLSDKFLKEAFR